MQLELTVDLGCINESALMGFNSTRLICSGKVLIMAIPAGRCSLFIGSERWCPQSRASVSPRSKDRAGWELTDPADVGHPALFRVSRFPMPNNEESDENPDQRCYQEELAHKTASMLYLGSAGRSTRKRPNTNSIREASRWQRNTLGTCCGLINSVDCPLLRRVTPEKSGECRFYDD